MQRTVASEARFLEAAEGNLDHRAGPAVDIDIACHEPFGNVEHVLEIVRPDRSAESVFGAVSKRDRFIDAVEGKHAQHRPKYLLLGQRAPGIDIDGDARRQVEAGPRHLAAAAVEREADAFLLRQAYRISL